VAARDGLTLTLEATGDCWIKYAVDEQEPVQVMLKAGETRQIDAAQSINLISIGNTQALALHINGREAHFPENTPLVLKKAMTITHETAGNMLD
jgi:hypothetical protein